MALANALATEGIKRIFSRDNLVEVIEALARSLLLAGLFAWMPRALIGDFAKLPYAPAAALAAARWIALEWSPVAGVALVSAMDVLYQRFSFARKMRISRRDTRQELKENEGDPMGQGTPPPAASGMGAAEQLVGELVLLIRFRK